MTKEEKQIEEKLQELAEEFLRNQRLMQKAFFRYEKLLSVKASLFGDLEALRDFREARRRNSLECESSGSVTRNGHSSRHAGFKQRH